MDKDTARKLALIEAAVTIRKSVGKPQSDDPIYQSVTCGMETVVWILKTGDLGFRPDVSDYPLLFELKEKNTNKAP